MSTGHHLFAPSSAHRWMKCAPSLAVTLVEGGTSSFEAAEGSVAHDMAGTCLQLSLDAHEVWQSVETASYDGHAVPISVEMRAYVQTYLDYVRALGGGLEVEQKIEFKADPDFGGTADALVWDMDSSTLHVIDFKYGKGIKVDSRNNAQMMCYALLALARGAVFDPVEVVLHIHQPRIDNISKWALDTAELVTFSSEVSKAITRARIAIKRYDKGEEEFTAPDFTPGTHCKFCPRSGDCIGLQEQSILNAQMVFGDISAVPKETLGAILAKADLIDTWIAAVRKHAMDRALLGETIDGYKLVQKRPMRRWVNAEVVERVALDNLIEVHEKVLMTPPALEKMCGSTKAFAVTFGYLVESVSSGLTLVSADDKRAAVDPATAAAEKAQAVFSAIE